ncbi:Holliday junction resolvase RecU [Halobacillus naozhouensis]|uniref:Holliday junction resolvase RecU n=2 Tax=Halobacillus naozhouensis TaxID=554880 RepID=A0ABY8J4C8_9BACI|nr:Holliday junction resolvase RecU [Halobacillus naozhouensis]WFT76921.1 Holliday junction resolvase RecU [Halobacillus naozhouensis]
MYQGNRGMGLENLINLTNDTYNRKGLAVINKRPTPVKVMKSKGTKVLSGFYESKSTVDYDGVYQGRAICFEAKSTGEKRFPLKNIHQHQLDYLYLAENVGALCFFLIEFRKLNQVFLVPFSVVQHYVEHAKLGGRKSITFDDFNFYAAAEVRTGNGVPLDYLPVLEKLIREGAA